MINISDMIYFAVQSRREAARSERSDTEEDAGRDTDQNEHHGAGLHERQKEGGGAKEFR